MMNKVAFLLFSSLTLGAGLMTQYDIGVQNSAIQQSIRQGSAGNYIYGGGK